MNSWFEWVDLGRPQVIFAALLSLLLVGMLIAALRRVTHRGQETQSSGRPEERARSPMLRLNEQRTEAIANALLMIEYAATHGRELPQDDVEVVLDISRKLDASPPPTAKEEARFWRAAAQISSKLTPSTVASIRERNHFVAITSEHTIKSILKRAVNLVISYFVVLVLII